jgi:DNA repair protein RadC
MRNRYLRKLHVELVDGEFTNPIQEQVRDPRQVFETFKSIKDMAQETVLAIYLWNDLRAAIYDVLTTGTQDATLLDPRELFGRAYVLRADYFILVHNHPSGDPNPSPTDREIIADLKRKATDMGVAFLDFVIVGTDSYWSMFEEEDGGEYSLGAAA